MSDDLQFELRVHTLLLEQALTHRKQWLALVTATDREIESLQLKIKDLREQWEAKSQPAYQSSSSRQYECGVASDQIPASPSQEASLTPEPGSRVVTAEEMTALKNAPAKQPTAQQEQEAQCRVCLNPLACSRCHLYTEQWR